MRFRPGFARNDGTFREASAKSQASKIDLGPCSKNTLGAHEAFAFFPKQVAHVLR